VTVPRKREPDCPIEKFIAVISGRWKAMILWRLLENPQRYSDLMTAIEKIPERALTNALAELREDGLVDRNDANWHLTPSGAAMRGALLAMYDWGIGSKLTRSG
jgi:DNA-binding HxlR family transcriptional regulator